MPDPVTVTVAVTVPPDEVDDFAELLTGNDDHCGDLLLRGFSGWWLIGVEHLKLPDGSWAWLVRDELDDDVGSAGDDAATATAIAQAGDDLPDGYFLVNRATAVEVLRLGVERYGSPDFYDGTADYGDIDNAVQLALLGEVRYG